MRYIIFWFLGFLVLFAAPYSYAQSKVIELTQSYVIADPEALDGDIIAQTENGFVRANSNSANKIFGVLQNTPTVVYRSTDNSLKPVVRSGTAFVNVMSSGGQISPGDYIGVSEKPGKGRKWNQPGFILGTALEPFDGTATDSGKIAIALKIGYFDPEGGKPLQDFIGAVNSRLFADLQAPQNIAELVRSLVAAIVFILTTIFVFIAFIRTVSSGTQAIGRNPMAKKAIIFSMVLNIALMTVITLLGIGAALFLLNT